MGGRVNTTPDKYFKRKVNESKVRCPNKRLGCEWVGELGDLDRRCPNKRLGCEWVGELGDLDRHLSQNSVEGECQFVTVACPYSCGSTFQRYQLEGHKANDCLIRPFTCQFCGHKATYITITGDHWPICTKYPVDCPNKGLGCQWAGEQQYLPKHLEESCPMRVMKCEFSFAGCEVECQRQHMQTHLEENVKVHLDIVSCRTKQQQSQINSMMAALSQLTSILGPSTVMVMTDFERHMDRNDFWYSRPFYPYFGGYKMCLCVCANGTGDGEATHVSVFVDLMRGEYDDQLKWPFRGDITIQLLNQSRDEGHREMVVTFDDTTSDEYAGRVVGKERAPSSLGYQQFIPHTELTTKNKSYLKNDCLEFKVSKFVVRNI